ncbi:uncharacterized protein LOC117801782 [Ailuropoda melanoleuca]|uniref:uncharacterized protein LOC117801782 n=1 Tax=Ailuropoda melanoleuca TaxID=9646 RepID=UPI001494653F|nr:uncharacterized protein LOC117801782 [Ailuropoda melanoleuca]
MANPAAPTGVGVGQSRRGSIGGWLRPWPNESSKDTAANGAGEVTGEHSSGSGISEQQCKRKPEYGHTDTWLYTGLITHGRELEKLSARTASALQRCVIASLPRAESARAAAGASALHRDALPGLLLLARARGPQEAGELREGQGNGPGEAPGGLCTRSAAGRGDPLPGAPSSAESGGAVHRGAPARVPAARRRRGSPPAAPPTPSRPVPPLLPAGEGRTITRARRGSGDSRAEGQCEGSSEGAVPAHGALPWGSRPDGIAAAGWPLGTGGHVDDDLAPAVGEGLLLSPAATSATFLSYQTHVSPVRT